LGDRRNASSVLDRLEAARLGKALEQASGDSQLRCRAVQRMFTVRGTKNVIPSGPIFRIANDRLLDLAISECINALRITLQGINIEGMLKIQAESLDCRASSTTG